MRRSTNRRAGSSRRFDRRFIAAAGAIVVFGAIAGVTQISRADTTRVASTRAGIKINGLDVLANTCKGTKLKLHDGFQKGNRCVTTQFGEVAAAAKNPSLLIVNSPQQVNVNQAFRLKVSTRNLIRDRFLGAAAGGYYVESSILKSGLVRGHFHTACRVLAAANAAPVADPVPDFFVATEDKKGSAKPDVVTINVPGIKKAGTVQCASWAGDGSHRIPMMERANQTPAFDSVRINVRKAAGQQGANNGGNNGKQGGKRARAKTRPNTDTTVGPNTAPQDRKPPKRSTPTKSPSGKTGNSATQPDTSKNGGDATSTSQKSGSSKTTTSKKATPPTGTAKANGGTPPDAGAQAGPPPGAPAGAQPGAPAGAPAGAQPGAPAGAQPGAPPGAQPGAPAGAQPGAQAGAQPGAQTSAQPGAQSDIQDAAEPAPKPASKGGLALTGTKTAAGIGTILLVVGGLIVFASNRRRRGTGGGGYW